jgi:hypothetical protein
MLLRSESIDTDTGDIGIANTPTGVSVVGGFTLVVPNTKQSDVKSGQHDSKFPSHEK